MRASGRSSEISSSYSSVGQNELLFPKHLLFLFCNASLKPPKHLTSSLAQDVLNTYIPMLPFCLGLLLHVGALFHVFGVPICMC